jgi:hypothetical protein
MALCEGYDDTGGVIVYNIGAEAEFLNVIGTKVSLLLFTVTYTNGMYVPPPPQKWFETGLSFQHCTVYGNLKSENSRDYAQKPPINCIFMNFASGFLCVHESSKLVILYDYITIHASLNIRKTSRTYPNGFLTIFGLR